MTAAEKNKIASFLDLAGDFLSTGYRNQREYNFKDEAFSENGGNENIEQIAGEIKNCKKCRLCETRTNAVPGEGVSHPVVMVIGEGPGYEEDIKGKPFVGKAGQLLDRMLASINLSRQENCFIANVVKCRPPKNRDPYPQEISECAGFLERQIAVLKPKVILAAGKISANALLKTDAPIGKLRGAFMDLNSESGIYPFLATYHPAVLLRDEKLKRPVWEDLKLLRAKIESSGDI